MKKDGKRGKRKEKRQKEEKKAQKWECFEKTDFLYMEGERTSTEA